MAPEKLNEYRQRLVTQQRDALAAFHQASGAIALIDALLADEAKGEQGVTAEMLDSAINEAVENGEVPQPVMNGSG